MEYCIQEGPKTHKLWLSQFALIVATVLLARAQRRSLALLFAGEIGSGSEARRSVGRSHLGTISWSAVDRMVHHLMER